MIEGTLTEFACGAAFENHLCYARGLIFKVQARYLNEYNTLLVHYPFKVSLLYFMQIKSHSHERASLVKIF